MNIKTVFLTIAISTLIIGCSDTTDDTVSTSNTKQNLKYSEPMIFANPEVVTTTPLEKIVREVDGESRFGVRLLIQNNSDKDITGIKGKMLYFDKFDDVIISLSVKNEDIYIASGESLDAGPNWEYNQYNSSHVQFMNTDFDDMRYEFQLDTVLFSDGSSS
jgi:hypothetical protein